MYAFYNFQFIIKIASNFLTIYLSYILIYFYQLINKFLRLAVYLIF